jgi:hypothetical protein
MTTETKEIKAQLQWLINNSPQRMNRAIKDGLFAEALLALVVRMEGLELSLGFKGEEEPHEL